VYNGAICFVSLAIWSDFLSDHALLSNFSLRSCPRRQGENKPAPCLACPHPSQSNFTKSALPHSCTNYLTKAAAHRKLHNQSRQTSCFLSKASRPIAFSHLLQTVFDRKFYHILPLQPTSAAPWFIQATSPRIHQNSSQNTPHPYREHPASESNLTGGASHRFGLIARHPKPQIPEVVPYLPPPPFKPIF